jgi:uncharacterized protein (DUF2141 family)
MYTAEEMDQASAPTVQAEAVRVDPLSPALERLQAFAAAIGTDEAGARKVIADMWGMPLESFDGENVGRLAEWMDQSMNASEEGVYETEEEF